MMKDLILQRLELISLPEIDHWLYGQCNNESDTQGISYLINHDYFKKSACIKKYYDSKTKKYYDKGHPNFEYPSISLVLLMIKILYIIFLFKNAKMI